MKILKIHHQGNIKNTEKIRESGVKSESISSFMLRHAILRNQVFEDSC